MVLHIRPGSSLFISDVYGIMILLSTVQPLIPDDPSAEQKHEDYAEYDQHGIGDCVCDRISDGGDGAAKAFLNGS